MLDDQPWDIAPADPFDPTTWEEPHASDTRLISLSDRICLSARVDYEDWLWARELKWCHTYGAGPMVEVAEGVWAMERPNHIYARNCAGGVTRWLHREILLRAVGKPYRSTYVGDHKNGDTLDCRRCNLRWATRRQNARNTPNSLVRKRFLKQMGVQ